MYEMTLFPFNSVDKNSNIIIYGAGKIARQFLYQIDKFNWCVVKKVVDTNYNKISNFPFKVDKPDIIKSTKFDYIVIAILNKSDQDQIISNLISMGIEKKFIICDTSRFIGRREDDTTVKDKKYKKKNNLKIAFLPSGGIGDGVVCLKIYQEIVKLTSKCSIDILWRYAVYAKSLFYGQKNIGRLIQFTSYDQLNSSDYDLIIEIHHVPRIHSVDLDRLCKLAPRLYRCVKKILDDDKGKVGTAQSTYMYRILNDRAKFLGCNRYSMLNISGAFDFHDQHVDLFIDRIWEKRAKKLLPNKIYATFNYGASRLLLGKQQSKIWPYEYYKSLIAIFKEKYPHIELIQLGASSGELAGTDGARIPGADKYIFDEDIGIVEYILKNSLFHFDCEGGLVHIATQLGTKCFVVFGPTPAWYYGYFSNVNIESNVCGGCFSLTQNWHSTCFKGYDIPKCMYSIKPDQVMDLIDKYLQSRVDAKSTM